MNTQASFRLDGRSVIVTGASSGLGVHFAVASAGAGADVVICGRRADRLQATRERVVAAGGRCLAVPADVTDVDDCRRVVGSALEAFGKVDVLINNAGAGSAVPATEETPDEFARVIDVNLFGAYWMAQACEQLETYLRPLAEGSVRSCFAMTEPDVASSDPTNLETTAVPEVTRGISLR